MMGFWAKTVGWYDTECRHEYKCKQHKNKLVLYHRTIRSEEHTAELHSDPLISPLTDVSVSPQLCLSLFFFYVSFSHGGASTPARRAPERDWGAEETEAGGETGKTCFSWGMDISEYDDTNLSFLFFRLKWRQPKRKGSELRKKRNKRR